MQWVNVSYAGNPRMARLRPCPAELVRSLATELSRKRSRWRLPGAASLRRCYSCSTGIKTTQNESTTYELEDHFAPPHVHGGGKHRILPGPTGSAKRASRRRSGRHVQQSD